MISPVKYFIVTFISILSILVPEKNIYDTSNYDGYVGFNMHIDSSIFNGYNPEFTSETLFEIDEIGKCELLKDYSAIILRFVWSEKIKHQGFYIFLNELPGPADYYIQITWNAIKGKSDLYLNGNLIRTENQEYYKPWNGILTSDKDYNISIRSKKITKVDFKNNYFRSKDIIKKVHKNLLSNNITSFLQENMPIIDIENLKGELLYSCDFSSENDLKDWILEGPGELLFNDKQLIMQSKIPKPSDVSTGHFNLWCPREFPDSIIVEWEFAPVSDHGVCHLFFSTTGKNGIDIFDTTLAKRDGHYSQYHSGDLNNYFIIYFSNWGILRTSNFATSSLHKSNPYSFLAHGTIGINPAHKDYHKVQLVKKGENIQLLINNNTCIDFKEDTHRWGAVNKNGKIAFRQMAETVAKYKNFKVYRIE